MSSPSPDSSPSPRRPWRLLVLLAVGIGLLAVVYLFTRDDPDSLYLRAREVAEANPGEAELLLYRAIAAAGDDFPPAQLLLCRVLGAQGRWVEARGGFSLIKEAGQCDPQELLDLSAAALSAGERVLPDMSLRAALASTTSDRAPALRLLIQAGAGRQDEQELAAWCEELARLDSSDALPWLVLANLRQRRRLVAPAIEAIQEALRRPLDAARKLDAQTELVELLIQIEDVADARNELDRLWAETGPATSLRLKNARLLRLEGQPQAALEEVNRVLSAEPDSIAALTLRGVVYLDLDRAVEAAADLEAVIARQPAVKEVHYKLASAYRRLERFEDAQRQLDISARLNRLSQEILALEARAEREPGNFQLLSELGDLCQQAEMVERAAHWRRLADAARRDAG